MTVKVVNAANFLSNSVLSEICRQGEASISKHNDRNIVQSKAYIAVPKIQ